MGTATQHTAEATQTAQQLVQQEQAYRALRLDGARAHYQDCKRIEDEAYTRYQACDGPPEVRDLARDVYLAAYRQTHRALLRLADALDVTVYPDRVATFD